VRAERIAAPVRSFDCCVRAVSNVRLQDSWDSQLSFLSQEPARKDCAGRGRTVLGEEGLCWERKDGSVENSHA
jgi:hypothetical protein